jgi:hypothetical protein
LIAQKSMNQCSLLSGIGHCWRLSAGKSQKLGKIIAIFLILERLAQQWGEWAERLLKALF